MPWLWIPPRGNLEKKAAFSPCCGDEVTIYYDRATGKKPVFPPCCGGKTTTCYMTEPKYKIWLCLSLWLIQDSNWKGELFGDYLEVSQQFFKTGFHVMNKK